MAHPRSRKILLENSLVTRAARGHHVRAFLAKTQAVTESAAAKNEIRSATRDLESRTLQEVPTEHSADDDFEIPTAHDLSLFAFERDEFGAAGVIALADDDFVQPVADVGA